MQFNPTEFLQNNADAFSKRKPLPPGDYVAVVAPLSDKSFKEGPRKDGTSYVALNIRLDIDISSNPEALTAVGGGTDKVAVFDSVFLDLKPDGKSLDSSPGKNRRLLQYREALGQNQPGVPWNPLQLSGQPVKVKIGHRDYQGEPQEEIQAITSL